jgi:murein L,D-transpeptidase YafK
MPPDRKDRYHGRLYMNGFYLALVMMISAVLIAEAVDSNRFRDQQQSYPRVRAARSQTEDVRDSLFRTAGLDYPPEEIFIRIFKHEEELELWARKDDKSPFTHVRTYPFTANSGVLGPKREEGDRQIPEGFYVIDWFNPASKFHLSIRINYPNRSDRVRANGDRPGGSIFIHGDRVTIGCVPVGDDAIDELYVIAVDARSEGQDKIPVHIFPCRMDNEEGRRTIQRYIGRYPWLKTFWEELRPGYRYFQQHRRLPLIQIDDNGKYIIGD